MLKKFYPKEFYNKTYDINFTNFYEKGYRGIIFDVDNTLAPHGAPADQEVIGFFNELRQTGFQTTLLSNNKEPRVKSFQEQVGGNYIFDGKKPSRKNYRRAMEAMGTNIENTLFVGDQIFTDIYGGNRSHLYTILVKPIHPSEEIQIVLKRYLENIVLYFYKLQK